jgi:phenylpyruvate tautomerase PptA (4-oxalocrotonate tautomerase family)
MIRRRKIMPYAEVSVSQNLINEEEKSIIAEGLTKILLKYEGLVDNPISRSIALLEIKEFDGLYVGGEKDKHDKAVIKVYIFADAINEEIKKKLFSEITKLFISVSDKVKAQNGRNVWCITIPLHEFDFAAGGIPVSLEMTRKLVSSYKK